MNGYYSTYLKVTILAVLSMLSQPVSGAERIEDVFTQERSRLTQLLESLHAENRLEGVRGLGYLGHHSGEDSLLRRLDDGDVLVRREAVFALGKLGSHKSIPALINRLEDDSWDVRELAGLALRRMTARDFGHDAKAWKAWWNGTGLQKKVEVLLQQVRSKDFKKSEQALTALKSLAGPKDEAAILAVVEKHLPGVRIIPKDVIQILERIGSERSVPYLAGRAVKGDEDAAWALGQIGGHAAEQALLKGLGWRYGSGRAFIYNLDRLHSTGCEAHLPKLLTAFGFVTSRVDPDDLDEHATPIQRAAASLILRTGKAPAIVDSMLAELEGAPRTNQVPWNVLFAAMRPELKPGFVRNDGRQASRPLGALPHIAKDPALAPRLIPLLEHPAFVPRIYVAMTLERLQAKEAIPDLLKIIDQGYSFSDSTALASGKHFGQSKTVRWLGYVPIAMGWMHCDEARTALERLAGDPKRPRDIRYGAAVGLDFMQSPKSLNVLKQVAEKDVIRAIQVRAQEAVERIERKQKVVL